jgi:hypothetical protein
MSKKAPNLIPAITHQRVREVIDYDPETGVFTRLWKSGKRTKVGEPLASGWYPRIAIDGEEIFAHRLAWFWVHGVWPPHEVDHIDGNAGNNRLSNLRLATASQNRRNMRETGRGVAGLKGVAWHAQRNCYVARIKYDGISTHLGCFGLCAPAAHFAYVVAAEEAFGEFARMA